jgi:hypothetical protein
MSIVREMIDAANEHPHDTSLKLHAGAFIDAPIFRHVQGLPSLFEEACEMAEFLSASESVSWRQMMVNVGAFSRYFSEAQRAINEGENDRAARALQALQFYSEIDEHTDYQQVISIIQAKLDG